MNSRSVNPASLAYLLAFLPRSAFRNLPSREAKANAIALLSKEVEHTKARQPVSAFRRALKKYLWRCGVWQRFVKWRTHAEFRQQPAFRHVPKDSVSTDRGEGRGVVFATGTPISNTLAEMNTMLRYLAPAMLVERKVEQL